MRRDGSINGSSYHATSELALVAYVVCGTLADLVIGLTNSATVFAVAIFFRPADLRCREF